MCKNKFCTCAKKPIFQPPESFWKIPDCAGLLWSNNFTYSNFFSHGVISLEKASFSWNLGGVSLPCSGALAEALFAGPFWPHLTLLRGTAGPEGVTGVWLVGGGGGGRGLGGAALVVLVADGTVAADDAVRPVTLSYITEKLFKQQPYNPPIYDQYQT